MLYKQEMIPVEAVGFLDTTDFEIQTSGKSFKSLIDNIYSRKIEAPIRELSTNAFDAHREAGIDEPFRIKLPTKFDPLFMVRDYGLGMTHEFIMGEGEFKGSGFKALFASTKDGDNKQVGMKGLGSKSPFAYTDSFILRVFSGTSVRTYSTYIGENGIPRLAFQGESPSQERRGTAVQFPVQTKDIEEFYSASIRVLKGFEVLPEGLPQTVLEGLSGVKATPLEVGATWKAYPKEWLGEGAFAKQGCVIYPMDVDKLKDGDWLKTLNMSLVIDFPIGSVQMVDSREFLAYDEETIANINAAVNAIHDEIDERIRSIMSTAATAWEIRALYRNDMFSNLGPLARGSTFYRSVNELNEYINKGIAEDRYDRKTGRYYFHAAVVRRSERSVCISDKTFATCYTRRDDGWNSSVMNNPIFVYIGDSSSKGRKQRKGMIKRAELLLTQDETISSVVLLDKLSLATHRKLGKAKVLRVTDLPKLPPAVRIVGDKPEWERFQRFGLTCHSFPELEEDELGKMKNVFLFINKGSLFLPERPAHVWGRTDLFAEDKLLQFFKGTRIVLINVRLNEKLSRWPEDKFPRYSPGLLDGIIPALPRAKIIPMINAINRDRFENSIYDGALSKLGRTRIQESVKRGISNPLFDLIRFDTRRDAMTNDQKKLFSSLSNAMIEEIIDRAVALGLEVLPECNCSVRKNRTGTWTFPYPLLKGKWEKLAYYLGEYSDSIKQPILIDLITKEF